MMQLWLNRYLRSSTPAASAMLSVGAHALIIAAAVVASGPSDTAATGLPDNRVARILLPPNRIAGEQPGPEMIKYVAIAVPEGALGATLQPADEIKPADVLSGLDARDAIRIPELPGADSVFSLVEVDSIAERYEWSAAPVYPPGMLEQRIEGSVYARYVVDEEGYADTASFRVLVTTHAEFTKAVRDALPYMRFKPAKIGRNLVRQLVEQEFKFRIAVADTHGTRKP